MSSSSTVFLLFNIFFFLWLPDVLKSVDVKREVGSFFLVTTFIVGKLEVHGVPVRHMAAPSPASLMTSLSPPDGTDARLLRSLLGKSGTGLCGADLGFGFNTGLWRSAEFLK